MEVFPSCFLCFIFTTFRFQICLSFEHTDGHDLDKDSLSPFDNFLDRIDSSLLAQLRYVNQSFRLLPKSLERHETAKARDVLNFAGVDTELLRLLGHHRTVSISGASVVRGVVSTTTGRSISRVVSTTTGISITGTGSAMAGRAVSGAGAASVTAS